MKKLIGLWLALTVGFAGIAFLDTAFPPPLDRVELSRVVTDADGLPLRMFPVGEGRWRLAADADRIDPRFIEALLEIEDKRFYQHGGVDLAAIIRAAGQNLARGEVVSGASTLTMQCARMLEPRPRTLPTKLIEMVRARQIERRLSKAEILELYLTLAPYGGNLEGLRTAARAYLGKDTEELTDAEIALLLALPQSPEARRPDLRPDGARQARELILQRLSASGFMTAARAAEARDDPLPKARHVFPSVARHAAERASGTSDHRNIVRTTIDRNTQLTTERLLRNAAERGGSQVQAAAMVVRIEDRAILASVGSADRSRPGGWLDLTDRRRSPGSTLKPLIYGLAMQEGLVAPGTLVADLPTRFGSYEPQNFGRSFAGELTIATALQHSLNVPAVQVLDLLGPERLVGSLRASGVDAAFPVGKDRDTGLAVALGGLGITARDLVMLYAALADGGVAKPLTDRVDGDSAPGVRMMSEEAANDLLTILMDGPSLAGRIPSKLSRTAPKVAFKTGTSYGFRDAWAVGVSGQYAVVVWIGRPDGAARPGVTGRDAALPVLFELFDHLETDTAGGEDRTPRQASPALAELRQTLNPVILFPPDGATLWPKRSGAPFVFAARGREALRWYVDGRSLPADAVGNVHWRPEGPGFYEVSVIDSAGRKATSSIRVVESAS